MLRFATLAVLLAAIACGRTPALRTDGVAFWYWHTPFQLSKEQSSELKQLGVCELYVRAATFSNDGEGLVPILPQGWPPSETLFKVHLVYNMDSGALRHFSDFDVASMAKAITDRFEIDKGFASKAGVQVAGIQLDFDVATRLLPRYAELLKVVRSGIKASESLSITSLPTWFGSGDFATVARVVDFYAPQFYDTSVPKKVDELGSISDQTSLEKGLEQADRLGRPYYAGIASFGRALLYDTSGALQGTYLALSPDQAMRHPGFVLEKEEQTSQERLLRFKAVRPGKNGRGKGWYLVFRIPKPSGVSASRELVRRQGGSSCMGTAIFRVPELEESMSVPLASILGQTEGKPVSAHLDLSANSEANPWSRIERQVDSDGQVRLNLIFENKGREPLQIGPKALWVDIQWEPGSVMEFGKGDFDVVDLTRNGMKSSLSSAHRALVKRWSLNVGEKATLGPFVLKRGTLLNCSWDAVSLSGVQSSGSKGIDWNGKEVETKAEPHRDRVR
jgi:hypothetical protein